MTIIDLLTFVIGIAIGMIISEILWNVSKACYYAYKEWKKEEKKEIDP